MLHESLRKYSEQQFKLFVLCLDQEVYEYFQSNPVEEIITIKLDELEQSDKKLYDVKHTRTIVEYYFTITPCWTAYLVKRYTEIDIINYLDADVLFFSTPESIFEELKENSILIIPHNFSEKFKELERFGKFNVGLVTFRNNVNGNICMNWWRERCIEWCHDRLEGDLFADQKYLDKWPDLFNGVKICQHPGMNLAAFNVDNFNISKKKGQFIVDGQALVFYHYHKLNQYSKNLWSLNLFQEKMYSNEAVVSIYCIAINRLKYFIEKLKAGIIINRFNENKIDSIRQYVNLFRKKIVFYHSGYFHKVISIRGHIKWLLKVKRHFIK